MDLVEALRGEDISKTDFFDFVSCPDSVSNREAASGGGGGEARSRGGGGGATPGEGGGGGASAAASEGGGGGVSASGGGTNHSCLQQSPSSGGIMSEGGTSVMGPAGGGGGGGGFQYVKEANNNHVVSSQGGVAGEGTNSGTPSPNQTGTQHRPQELQQQNQEGLTSVFDSQFWSSTESNKEAAAAIFDDLHRFWGLPQNIHQQQPPPPVVGDNTAPPPAVLPPPPRQRARSHYQQTGLGNDNATGNNTDGAIYTLTVLNGETSTWFRGEEDEEDQGIVRDIRASSGHPAPLPSTNGHTLLRSTSLPNAEAPVHPTTTTNNSTSSSSSSTSSLSSTASSLSSNSSTSSSAPPPVPVSAQTMDLDSFLSIITTTTTTPGAPADAVVVNGGYHHHHQQHHAYDTGSRPEETHIHPTSPVLVPQQHQSGAGDIVLERHPSDMVVDNHTMVPSIPNGCIPPSLHHHHHFESVMAGAASDSSGSAPSPALTLASLPEEAIHARECHTVMPPGEYDWKQPIIHHHTPDSLLRSALQGKTSFLARYSGRKDEEDERGESEADIGRVISTPMSPDVAPPLCLHTYDGHTLTHHHESMFHNHRGVLEGNGHQSMDDLLLDAFPEDYEKLRRIENEVAESVRQYYDVGGGAMAPTGAPLYAQKAPPHPSQDPSAPPPPVKPPKKYNRRAGGGRRGANGANAATGAGGGAGNGERVAGGVRKERSLHYCSICSKGFKDKYSVNVHIRTHTGEKPFTCSLCGKSFRQKAHLAKHYQTHAQKTAAAAAAAAAAAVAAVAGGDVGGDATSLSVQPTKASKR